MHQHKVEIQKIKNLPLRERERERERVITFFVWENMYRMRENNKFMVREHEDKKSQNKRKRKG